MAKAANVILVHGAWADGSSWSKVIPLLESPALRVTAVQLPLTSFDSDVATVRRAIALAEGPTVLVGHSYGGVVITETGNDAKVVGLVYIAAFAPDAGQSAGSLGAGVAPAPMGAEIRPDKEGYLKLTEAGVKNDFAQDLTPPPWVERYPFPHGKRGQLGTSLRPPTAPSSPTCKGRWRTPSEPRRSRLRQAMLPCWRARKRRRS